MRNVIIGIGVAAGAALTFSLWCCIRVGAMADRAMGILDDVEEETARYQDRMERLEEVIEDAGQAVEETNKSTDLLYSYMGIAGDLMEKVAEKNNIE